MIIIQFEVDLHSSPLPLECVVYPSLCSLCFSGFMFNNEDFIADGFQLKFVNSLVETWLYLLYFSKTTVSSSRHICIREGKTYFSVPESNVDERRRRKLIKAERLIRSKRLAVFFDPFRDILRELAVLIRQTKTLFLMYKKYALFSIISEMTGQSHQLILPKRLIWTPLRLDSAPSSLRRYLRCGRPSVDSCRIW